ncbi:4559_t:CDS:2 [Diversispora eburnea]|uniref:4559_t:CDS:1 n=1 Tax=Diversispora eburnea TaxID=1213867 RepID=A0A9N9BJS7_9GLOM|nr:4559_t:CDS:2 [Diversispora eburnea]
MSLINAPLTRKLPVSFDEETNFSQLADFIETKNGERGSNLSKHISYLLTNIVEKQNLNSTSKDMLHWGIYSIIRIPLQIFHENIGGGVLPIEMDRNGKETTAIGNKRPDFLYWTNNVLLYKGEEKAAIEDFSKAKTGVRLRFFAIDGSSNINSPRCLVTLSNQFDMSNRRDRVSILCIVVNIARIMRTVSNIIPEMIVPLFVVTSGYQIFSLFLVLQIINMFLSIFEHANVGGLVVSERLKDWDNKTLTKKNVYTAQFDLGILMW